MSLIACPCCGGEGVVQHGNCNGAGCAGCAGDGWVECAVCGTRGEVEEPLLCSGEECPNGGAHGNRDPDVVRAMLESRITFRSTLCLDCARMYSVLKRWATQAKKCPGCEAFVIWRSEGGKPRTIDKEGRAHACP